MSVERKWDPARVRGVVEDLWRQLDGDRGGREEALTRSARRADQLAFLAALRSGELEVVDNPVDK
jgi:hypothetical protein